MLGNPERHAAFMDTREPLEGGAARDSARLEPLEHGPCLGESAVGAKEKSDESNGLE